jgi:uncharacterized protein HemX
MVVVSPSGDYSQPHVPTVFFEQAPPPPENPKQRDSEGGLVISRGFLGALVVLLLGAAIAGTGGFYWLWKGAAAEGKKAVAEVQAKLDAAQKTNLALTEERTALIAAGDKARQALAPYSEIERLKGLTEAERRKIDDLLKVPSKVDYWKFHKAVDLQDPVVREPAERALEAKLEVLRKVSEDIGLWSKPTGGGVTTPPPGVIRPSQNR